MLELVSFFPILNTKLELVAFFPYLNTKLELVSLLAILTTKCLFLSLPWAETLGHVHAQVVWPGHRADEVHGVGVEDPHDAIRTANKDIALAHRDTVCRGCLSEQNSTKYKDVA